MAMPDVCCSTIRSAAAFAAAAATRTLGRAARLPGASADAKAAPTSDSAAAALCLMGAT